MSAVYSSVSGQDAVFKQMQVIANNLANMSTSGYKAERLVFEQAMTAARAPEGSLKSEIEEPSTQLSSYYTGIKGSYTDFTQGALENTNNGLNAAIQGDGFFVVNTPEGERFTRSGEFTLDSAGRLVSATGHPVQGQGGEIIAIGASPRIMADGTVMAGGESVGRLRVVSLDSQGLVREAAQLFKAGDGASPQDVEEVLLAPGAVEASNVNATRELTDMVLASRAFEQLQKAQESNSRMSRARQEAFGRV